MNQQMTWFFLRGLVRESEHWNGFLEQFSQYFPGVKTIELDLPGSGAHFDGKSPSTVPGMVDYLRAEFLQKKGARNGLFAISLGGMVGIDWMQRFPEDFSKAVLVNTSLRGISPLYQRMLPRNYLSLIYLALARDPYAREKKILAMTSNRFETDEKIAQDWAEIQRKRPVSTRNAIRQLLAAIRYRPCLSPPKSEILVLSSRGDRLVDSKCSDQLTKLWNLRQAIHESAGHDLTLDEAAWALAQVKAAFPDIVLD